MKIFCVSLVFLFSWVGAGQALAQDRIYRCGNEYTNTVSEAQAKNCKLLSGGNVTVVQAVKVPKPANNTANSANISNSANNSGNNSTSGNASNKGDGADQRAKEADARLILEAELKKAESRQAELLKTFNNGEPEKMGPEFRNHQKYLDRVAEMKAEIARNDGDIAGIRRELGRLPAPAAAK